MKSKITPTNQQRELRDDDFIVSKTDLKGRITYCNRIFMEIAGYEESELLGIQHNIIRHPDMPRAVFNMLWETLKGGQEFFGYIKNLCKDGSHYWVFANVTPSYNHKAEVVGYYSVRRRPRPEALQIITPIYQEMLAAEKKAGAVQAIPASSAILKTKIAEFSKDYEHFILEI
jgi:PAS domain S-box-containing protein